MTAPPLRLAVYGFVQEGAGSLADANYLVVDRLLRAGHRVDLYAIDGFIAAGRLAGRAGFDFVPVGHGPSKWVWRLIERIRRPALHRAAGVLFSFPSGRFHYAAIAAELARRHRADPYDGFLALGLLAPFRPTGVPTVSWTQGPVNGEWGWIAANWWRLTREGGWRLTLPLAALYLLKYLELRLDLGHSDLVVTGSMWASGRWRRLDVPPDKLRELPYPFDLSRFRVTSPADGPPDHVTFVHFGRIVPRKRVDLLMDGFRLHRRTHPGSRLVVVGRGSYGVAAEMRRLADGHAAGEWEYRDRVPRDEIVRLLERADAVVQTSENENFGSAVAEGLATGKAVLLGPTNGTADYAGRRAVVFDAYTPEAVAAGMARVAELITGDRAGVAADSRLAAETWFDPDRVADELVRQCRAFRHSGSDS